jgi:magnesium transporter
MSCDGTFDSGAKLDYCGTCQGKCIGDFINPANKACECLRCNGAVDACGVCGGNNSTCSQFITFTRQELIGFTLALSGNVLISASLNLQKYAHNRNQAESGGTRPYVELPLWWVGLLLMTLGETGNFLAYAYAPATLVAPLGAVSVISNSVLAHYVLKEKLDRRNLAGVALAILGAVLIVVYAPSSDKQLTMDVLEQYMSEAGFIVFVICILVALLFLFLLRDSVKRRYVVVYVLICSLTGSLTVMCVKGVSTALILTFQGHGQFDHVLPWIMLITTIGTLLVQLRYLNLAMMHFGASEVTRPLTYQSKSVRVSQSGRRRRGWRSSRCASPRRSKVCFDGRSRLRGRAAAVAVLLYGSILLRSGEQTRSSLMHT